MRLKELIASLQELEDKFPNKEAFVQIYDNKRDEYEINKNAIIGDDFDDEYVILYVTYNTGNVVFGVGASELADIKIVDAKRLQDILITLDNDAKYEGELAIIEEAEEIIRKVIYPEIPEFEIAKEVPIADISWQFRS